MATELLIRRAPLAASSWKPDERTLEVVFSTGASVERTDARGSYVERLDLNQDWSSFIGAPVLNAHKRGDVTDVLGHVIKAWTVSSSEARAIIKLSRRQDVETVVQDVLDGHLRGVSVGYGVAEWREGTEGGKRTKTATRWAPAELSIVPVAADPGATIRSEAIMPEPTTTTTEPTQSALPLATRAAVNQEIRSIGNLAGLDQAWIDGQIDASATADAARAAAFQAIQARGPAPIQTARTTVVRDNNDPLEIRAAMADALAYRLSPGRLKLEGRARDFVHHRVLDMVGDLAHARGDHVNLRDQIGLAERAVGAHSTSDFPLLLADAANKSLLANYQAAEPTYRRWAARRPFKDLKAHHFARIGDFPPFKRVGESGEAQYGSISENSEQVFAHSFNSSFGVTRDALINDDLSALADFSSMIARRAAADENRFVYGELIGSTSLRDGKPVFHADHENLAGGSAQLSAPLGLAAGVRAIRSQTGLDDLPLNLTPRFLVVGPELEVEARKLLTSVTPTKSSDVNPWSGSLELIVDGNITGTTYFVMVDAADAPTIVYGYIGGNEGPQIFTETDFDTRGVKVSAWLDFGWGPIDFRGAYKGTASLP